jgi:hypothetical protein
MRVNPLDLDSRGLVLLQLTVDLEYLLRASFAAVCELASSIVVLADRIAIFQIEELALSDGDHVEKQAILVRQLRL